MFIDINCSAMTIQNNADIVLLYHTKKDLAARSTRSTLAKLSEFYKVNPRTYDLQCDLVWILALHIIMSHKRRVGKLGEGDLRIVKITDGSRVKQIPLDAYGRLSLATLRVFGRDVVGIQDETTEPPTVIPLKTKKSSSLHQTATTMDQTKNITTVSNWRWDANKTYNVIFDRDLRISSARNNTVIQPVPVGGKLASSNENVSRWIAYLLPMLMMLIYIKLHTVYRHVSGVDEQQLYPNN